MQTEPLLVTSRENRWVKLAIRLREKKYREQEKLFWLEGERTLEDVLPYLSEVIALLIQEQQWEKWRNKLPSSCWNRVVLLPPGLASAVTAAETFSGVGAIVKMPHWDLQQITSGGGLWLYLDRIADPGNLGTMIRTAVAMNVKAVLLSPGCADVFNPKVVRAAMGLLMELPVFRQVGAETLRSLRKAGFQITGAALKPESKIYSAYDYAMPQVVVIGSEAFGISDEIDKLCHNCVKIPINFKAESLNAAIACGIILAEINRQQDIESF